MSRETEMWFKSLRQPQQYSPPPRRKCWSLSRSLPELAGDPEQSARDKQLSLESRQRRRTQAVQRHLDALVEQTRHQAALLQRRRRQASDVQRFLRAPLAALPAQGYHVTDLRNNEGGSVPSRVQHGQSPDRPAWRRGVPAECLTSAQKGCTEPQCCRCRADTTPAAAAPCSLQRVQQLPAAAPTTAAPQPTKTILRNTGCGPEALYGRARTQDQDGSVDQPKGLHRATSGLLNHQVRVSHVLNSQVLDTNSRSGLNCSEPTVVLSVDAGSGGTGQVYRPTSLGSLAMPEWEKMRRPATPLNPPGNDRRGKEVAQNMRESSEWDDSAQPHSHPDTNSVTSNELTRIGHQVSAFQQVHQNQPSDRNRGVPAPSITALDSDCSVSRGSIQSLRGHDDDSDSAAQTGAGRRNRMKLRGDMPLAVVGRHAVLNSRSKSQDRAGSSLSHVKRHSLHRPVCQSSNEMARSSEKIEHDRSEESLDIMGGSRGLGPQYKPERDASAAAQLYLERAGSHNASAEPIVPITAPTYPHLQQHRGPSVGSQLKENASAQWTSLQEDDSDQSPSRKLQTVTSEEVGDEPTPRARQPPEAFFFDLRSGETSNVLPALRRRVGYRANRTLQLRQRQSQLKMSAGGGVGGALHQGGEGQWKCRCRQCFRMDFCCPAPSAVGRTPMANRPMSDGLLPPDQTHLPHMAAAVGVRRCRGEAGELSTGTSSAEKPLAVVVQAQPGKDTEVIAKELSKPLFSSDPNELSEVRQESEPCMVSSTGNSRKSCSLNPVQSVNSSKSILKDGEEFCGRSNSTEHINMEPQMLATKTPISPTQKAKRTIRFLEPPEKFPKNPDDTGIRKSPPLISTGSDGCDVLAAPERACGFSVPRVALSKNTTGDTQPTAWLSLSPVPPRQMRYQPSPLPWSTRGVPPVRTLSLPSDDTSDNCEDLEPIPASGAARSTASPPAATRHRPLSPRPATGPPPARAGVTSQPTSADAPPATSASEQKNWTSLVVASPQQLEMTLSLTTRLPQLKHRRSGQQGQEHAQMKASSPGARYSSAADRSRRQQH